MNQQTDFQGPATSMAVSSGFVDQSRRLRAADSGDISRFRVWGYLARKFLAAVLQFLKDSSVLSERFQLVDHVELTLFRGISGIISLLVGPSLLFTGYPVSGIAFSALALVSAGDLVALPIVNAAHWMKNCYKSVRAAYIARASGA